MPTNIELKAHLKDPEKSLAVVKSLSGKEKGTIIEQHDIFFDAPNCRLKLRRESQTSSLIAYDRADVSGSKRSDFEKVFLDDPDHMLRVLGKSMGIQGEVKKSRVLFVVPYNDLLCRVHLDSVDKLGNFIEFEVMLVDESQVCAGEEMITYLREKFEIEDEDLVIGAYMDHILTKENKINAQ